MGSNVTPLSLVKAPVLKKNFMMHVSFSTLKIKLMKKWMQYTQN
jgi:hypothetical protein